MTPTKKPAPEHIIREELEKIASLITGARRLMREGRSVDLSAVEDRVRAITKAVTSAPPNIAVTFKDHLSTLIDILDNLQADIESQHKDLEGNLTAMKRRAATDAYGSSSLSTTPVSTSPKPKPKKE